MLKRNADKYEFKVLLVKKVMILQQSRKLKIVREIKG